jgi:hypothetical protein
MKVTIKSETIHMNCCLDIVTLNIVILNVYVHNFDFVHLPGWTGVATWRWVANDDNCGICRMAFDGCCPDCKLPGDDCPLGTKFCYISFIFISH